MRVAGAVAIALLLACAAARAGTGAAFAENVIDVRLNGDPVAHTLITRVDGEGALLIKAGDLPALRLKPPASGLMLVNGERYYRFANGDGVRVEHQPETQSVALTLPASAFLTTRNTARDMRPAPRPTVSTGGFVNYDVSYEQTQGHRQTGAFVEGGVFGTHGVVTATALARNSREERSAVRLDTTWTRDFPEQVATLRAGDTITSTGSWGRAARIGGVQFGTNFSTQPTLVTTPLLSAQGEALVPSTVDVFVNGQRVANESVPAGPFAIDNVPAINGAGQMQVVVTDALGRQQVISQPYYSGSALLQAGLDEYSLELGAIRRNYTTRSFDYGQWVAAGTWRRGLSDAFTAEGHFEATGDGTSALGTDAALQLGRLGIVSATAAYGGNDDGDGWLAGMGFQRNGPRLSVFASTQWSSEAFAQLGTSSLEDRPRQRSFGGIGLNLLKYGALQFAYGMQDFWNAARVETLGISYSLTLGPFGFLSLFASHNRGGDEQTDAQLSWTMPFGDRRSTSASLRHGPDGSGGEEFEAIATLQQNLPVGPGSGYQVSLSTDDDYRLAYAYQGRAGQANAEYASRDGRDGWRAGVIGGVALTGAGVMASRTLDQSFAVVKVADFADVPVFVENQLVGRTDRKGRVLIDTLRPYESNEVSVDPTSLPMDASLSTASITITPAYRSGALVAFPVRRASAVTFRLRLASGRPVPAGAMVTTAGSRAPVAFDGLVYLEQAEGRQDAAVEWKGGLCRFAFVRGKTEEPVPDLGNITCRTDAP